MNLENSVGAYLRIGSNIMEHRGSVWCFSLWPSTRVGGLRMPPGPGWARRLTRNGFCKANGIAKSNMNHRV